METAPGSVRARIWRMPASWRAIHSVLSRPVMRKKHSVPRALSSAAAATAAVTGFGGASGTAADGAGRATTGAGTLVDVATDVGDGGATAYGVDGAIDAMGWASSASSIPALTGVKPGRRVLDRPSAPGWRSGSSFVSAVIVSSSGKAWL